MTDIQDVEELALALRKIDAQVSVLVDFAEDTKLSPSDFSVLELLIEECRSFVGY